MTLEDIENFYDHRLRYIFFGEGNLLADDLLGRRTRLGDVLVHQEPLKLLVNRTTMGNPDEVGVHETIMR